MIAEAPVKRPEAGLLEKPLHYTAVVLAGMRPEGDPVAEFFGSDCKALTPLRGQPMIRRVLEVLGAAPSVHRIVLVGNSPERFAPVAGELRRTHPGTPVDIMRAATGSITTSVRAVIDEMGEDEPLLVTTGDAALLTPEIVEAFTQAACAKPGVSVGVVDREIIRRGYPDTVRTYHTFRDKAVSGANLFAFCGRDVRRALEFWQTIEQDRKRTWKFLRAFGPANLAGMVFRRFTLDQALERAGRVIGCAVRAVCLPVAEAAMDVDSVQDYFLAERILELREKSKWTPRAAGSVEAMRRFAVFDLDRTVTRHGTFTPFLLSTRRSLASRTVLMARILGPMLEYILRRIDRLTLKNRMLALTAEGLNRGKWEAAAERFVHRVVRRDIRPGFLPALDKHRRAGDTLVLATASIDLYARLLADHFKFDQVICTSTAFAVPSSHQPPKIAGRNCLGAEKQARVAETLLPDGTPARGTIFVSVYSDDASDLPLLEWADAATVVCPGGKTRAAAAKRRMEVVQW